MAWSVAAVAVLGILLGFRFRAPALILATAVTVVVSAIVFGLEGASARRVLVSVLLLAVTLQAAYLGGLFLSLAWRRLAAGGKWPPPDP